MSGTQKQFFLAPAALTPGRPVQMRLSIRSCFKGLRGWHPITLCVAGLGCVLLGGGCTSAEMKGTPFYRGEYGKRRGPAEQRVNAWPLVYYRNPALSVLWPVLEFTDDHTAIRPFFSVYGLDRTNREYNVLWPIAQFDRETGDNHIFPVFWGSEHRVAFPLYWHYGEPFGADGGWDSLFPLWVLHREQTNVFSLYTPWPLVHHWSDQAKHAQGSMVFPLYWHRRDDEGSRFVSLPWLEGKDHQGSHWQLLTPFYYHVSDANHSAFATPLWAQGHSQTKDWRAVIPLCYWEKQEGTLLSPLWAHWQGAKGDRYFAPWALSWMTRKPERDDLWLALGLAHASWGAQGGPHHVFPLYYRNAADGTLLTPLFGWDHPEGFMYPATPLFGLRNGATRGSWLFPLYSHSREPETGDLSDHALLLAGHNKSRQTVGTWFYPLFSWHDYGPLDSSPKPSVKYGHYGTGFWCLPICWYRNQCNVRPARPTAVKPGDTGYPTPGDSIGRSAAPGPETNAPLVRDYKRQHGVFPLWTYSNKSIPAEGRQTLKSSVLLAYNYKHEVGPSVGEKTPASDDYTRASIFWRLWHYERLNGNVSVDVFPAITYDRKADGFRKTAFLWRCFRYERAASGATKLNVLFIPLKSGANPPVSRSEHHREPGVSS